MEAVEAIRDVNSAQHQDLKSAKYAPLNGKIAPLGVSAVNAESKDESDPEVNEGPHQLIEDEVVEDAIRCNGGMNAGGFGTGYSEHSENQTQSEHAISTSSTLNGVPDPGPSVDVAALLSAVKAQRSAHRDEVAQFKSAVTSQLRRIRRDCEQQESLVRRLQRDVSSAAHDKKKQRAARDKQVRAKDSELKALRAKYNETRSELTRSKQSVDKVRDEGALKLESLLRKVEKLEKDKATLCTKVDRAQTQLEAERKEKSQVKANNAEWLRGEKAKIAKALDKEVARTRRLEDRVGGLEEECAAKTADNKQRAARLKQLEERDRRQQAERTRANQERDEAVASMQRKNAQMKAEKATLDETLAEIAALRRRDANQISEIKQLHEAVRKKSEREKQFDEIRKRLGSKERKLEEREKALKQQLRQSKARRQQAHGGGSSAKKQRGSNVDNDPLSSIRNVAPWHWISIVLLMVLMLAISQRR